MLQTVAIRTPKHLCIKDNALVIREKKSSEVIGKIALSDIWVIIIDNPQVTMTSALMSGMPTSSFSIAKPVTATAWTRADAQGKT